MMGNMVLAFAIDRIVPFLLGVIVGMVTLSCIACVFANKKKGD